MHIEHSRLHVAALKECLKVIVLCTEGGGLENFTD